MTVPLGLRDRSEGAAGTRPLDPAEATPEQMAAWLDSYARERDPELRERVILAHHGLADRLAMRYRDRPNTTPDDLRQIARIGLIAAVDRYDPERGTPFAPFAIATILGQLKRYLRDSTWQVGVPRTVKDNALRLAAALDGFPRSFDGWPHAERMAGQVDLDEEEIRQAVMAMENRTVLSLDVPVEQGAPPLGQLLPDTAQRSEVEDLIMLPDLVSSLPAVERAVVVLYYFNGLKQREIGALIGCSQMQVSRLLRRSCERLHDQLVAADA
jgi:RNA polymerase sigma-B factor